MRIDVILPLAWAAVALASRVLMARAGVKEDYEAEYRASRVYTTALIWLGAGALLLLLRV